MACSTLLPWPLWTGLHRQERETVSAYSTAASSHFVLGAHTTVFPRLPGFRGTATLCNCAEFHERLKREYYILTRRQSAWGGTIFGSYLAAIAYNEDFATLSGRTWQNIMAQILLGRTVPWFHPVCSPASAVITPANKAVSPACFAAPQTVATGNMR